MLSQVFELVLMSKNKHKLISIHGSFVECKAVLQASLVLVITFLK